MRRPPHDGRAISKALPRPCPRLRPGPAIGRENRRLLHCAAACGDAGTNRSSNATPYY